MNNNSSQEFKIGNNYNYNDNANNNNNNDVSDTNTFDKFAQFSLSPDTNKPDYFSLHHHDKNSSTASSPGTIRRNSIFLPAIKTHPVRYPTNLNLFLSPIITSPAITNQSEEFCFDQSINPKSAENKDVNYPYKNQPSIIDDLQKNVYNIKKENVLLDNSTNMPHNYLNINLKNGEFGVAEEFNDLNIISEILKDYTLKKKIQIESNSDAITNYLATHNHSKETVLIRFTSQLTLGSISRLVNSYYITSDLNTRVPNKMFPHIVDDPNWNYEPCTCSSDIKGIIPCQKIKFTNNHSCLITIYPIGDECVTLKQFAPEIKNDIHKLTMVLINLLKIVEKIHQYGIVINSLNLINILINPKTLETSILGFDFAFSSVYENLDDTYRSTNKLHSASYIPYTAPENFRSSYMVDFRADIYSIGSIFHNIITGRNFNTSNMIDLITQLMTSSYQDLNDFDESIPLEFSNIIARMVKIEPTERYSSISFIIHDLSKLYKDLNSLKPNFTDISPSRRVPIMIPSKVIGRSEIEKELMNMISTKGVSSMTLIGELGIGKSCLLENLKPSVLIKKMFCTLWKCEDSNIFKSKFHTFDLIISKLLKEILSMSKYDIIFWRDLIISEIKVDLSVLYEFVPELKILIGTKYRNRRHTDIDKILNKNELGHLYILKRLFEIVSKHAGWVLIIENLEFLSEADASLLEEIWLYLNKDLERNDMNFKLITSMNTDKTVENLDLQYFLKTTVHTLGPLTLPDVEELIQLSFQLQDSRDLFVRLEDEKVEYFYDLKLKSTLFEERKKFAEHVYFQTGGNPLMIKEILNQLFLYQLQHPKIPNSINVYNNFLNNQLIPKFDNLYNSYNEQTLQILKYTACLAVGNTVNLYDLLVVSGLSISEVHTTLFTGTIAFTFLPSSIISKLPIHLMDDPSFILSQLKEEERINVLKCTKFKFSHELVKFRIIKNMEDSNELDQFHRLCGLKLFENAKSRNKIQELSSFECFSIAAHFLKSYKYAENSERQIYTQILISAGWYAYFSYEITASLRFFQTAIKLGDDLDTLKGLRWIQIHIYELKKQHETCVKLSEEALVLYKDVNVDAAQFMISKMHSLRSLCRYEEAYGVCLEALKILNFKLDLESMTSDDIIAYTNDVLKPLLPSSLSEIKKLDWRRQNTDRKVLLIQSILSELNMFSVHVNKLYLIPFCNLMNFSLFIDYGSSVFCCMSMIIIASIEAASDVNGIRKAQEYCRLGFSMFKHRTLETDEVFVICFRWYCALTGSIIEPLEKIEPAFDLSILNTKIQFLDSNFAKGLILKFKFHIWVSQGITLPHLIEKMKILKEVHKPKVDTDMIFECMYRCVAGVLNVLEGETTYDQYIDYANQIGVEHLKLLHIYLIYNTNKCFLCYMNKKYEIGGDIAMNKVLPEWKEELASIETVWGRFVFALLVYKDTIRRRNDDSDNLDNETKLFIEDAMKQNLMFFEELSAQNPSLSTCKFLIIDALMKALDTENFCQLDVLAAFEKAVEMSGEKQFYLLQAIAAEECAVWARSISKSDKISTKFFKIAIRSYRNFGFYNRANELEVEIGPSALDLDVESFGRPENSRSRIFSNYNTVNDYDLTAARFNIFKGRKSDNQNSIGSDYSYMSHVGSSGTNTDTNDMENLEFDTPTGVRGATINTKSSSLVTSGDEKLTLIKYGKNKSENIFEFTDDDLRNETILNLSVKLAQSDDVCEIMKSLLVFSLKYFGSYYASLILNSEDGTPFIKAICFSNHEVRFMPNEILSLRGDLAPAFLIQECMKTGKSIWRNMDRVYFDDNFKERDPYFNHNTYEDVVCIPITDRNVIVGALYLENIKPSNKINQRKIELLNYICLQGYISINKIGLFEKMKVAKKAAEGATSDRNNFLANMSHEIRTPFNSLMSCAIFLLDTQLTKTQQMYVETIKNSALVTLNIIDGILSFSKLEHGTLTLAYEPFDLSLCIEDATLLVAEQASSKELELVFRDYSNVVNMVYGDKTRITQIIINLLGNATKFTNVGHVIIELNAQKISQTRFEFTIHVIDSGIGIPAGSKSKLFKPFNQLDGSSTREFGGSGLGLAISKRLAEYMGGTLDYESEEGKKTDFCFTFSSKCEIQKEESIKQPNEKHVLIFDSRNLSSYSLKESLITLGFDEKNISLENTCSTQQNKSENPSFVFVFFKLLDTETKFNELKSSFPNAKIILEIPFGSKLPDFIEFDENKFKGNDSIQILMNPFKKQFLEDIINNNIDEKANDDVDTNHLERPQPQKKHSNTKLAERCPLSIIVAEDNMINAKVVKLQLKRLGYTSALAKDGVELLEMFDTKISEDGTPYDLVLMDLQMLRKDGFEATIDIKNKYGESTRVVALSANVYTEEKNRCVEVGMRGFLNKPLMPDALIAQLEKAFSERLAI